MNDKEKDLLNVQDSSADTQSVNEDILVNETQPLNEKVQTNDPDGAVSEKVEVKNIEEPGEEVLFGGYEIKNWEFSPRIYKIVGAATIFNLLGLFVIAQTNMLSTSACESPFVNNVCQVLDTVYVGSKLFDGSNEYGRQPFDPTEINSEDVVWIPEDGITPPISYPEGYFQIANRDEIAAREALMQEQEGGFGNSTSPYSPPAFNPTPTSKPPSSSGSRVKSPSTGTKPWKPRRSPRRGRSGGNSLITKKQKLPESSTTTGEVKSGLFTKKGKNGENTAKKPENEDPKVNNNTIANQTAKKSDPEKEVDVNKLPLELYVVKFLENKEVNEIEIKKPFAVQYSGQLNKDGTFKNIRLRQKNAEPAVFELVNEGIKALGSSKFLKYLTDLDVKDIKLTIIQNDTDFQAVIESSQPTPELAKTMASGLNGFISLGKYAKNKEINGKDGEKDPVKLQGEKDELYLLNNATVTNQGKNFIFTIKLPRAEAQEMIKRRLDSEAAKREKDPNYAKPEKPNGSAKTVKSDDNKAK